MNFLIAAFFVCGLLLSDNCLAGPVTKCLSFIEQAMAAIAAKDVDATNRIAKAFSDKCGEQSEMASSAPEWISKVSNATGNFATGLQAAEECLTIHYSNTVCHLEKIEALLGLCRMADAEKTIEGSTQMLLRLSSYNQIQNEDDQELLHLKDLLYQTQLQELKDSRAKANKPCKLNK